MSARAHIVRCTRTRYYVQGSNTMYIVYTCTASGMYDVRCTCVRARTCLWMYCVRAWCVCGLESPPPARVFSVCARVLRACALLRAACGACVAVSCVKTRVTREREQRASRRGVERLHVYRDSSLGGMLLHTHIHLSLSLSLSLCLGSPRAPKRPAKCSRAGPPRHECTRP